MCKFTPIPSKKRDVFDDETLLRAENSYSRKFCAFIIFHQWEKFNNETKTMKNIFKKNVLEIPMFSIIIRILKELIYLNIDFDLPLT